MGVYLARMNLSVNDEDEHFPALIVANYLFGDGAELSSRMMARIRQKDGLSYEGGSSLRISRFDNAATFQIHAIAASQNLMQVMKAINEEINRILTEGFSEEEVTRAKSGLKQQAVQMRSHDANLAADWNDFMYQNRTYFWALEIENKIATLTAAQVNAAFKKMINPGKLTIVIAGDDVKRKE